MWHDNQQLRTVVSAAKATGHIVREIPEYVLLYACYLRGDKARQPVERICETLELLGFGKADGIKRRLSSRFALKPYSIARTITAPNHASRRKLDDILQLGVAELRCRVAAFEQIPNSRVEDMTAEQCRRRLAIEFAAPLVGSHLMQWARTRRT